MTQEQEVLILILLAVVAGLVAYSVWRGRRQSTIFEQVERVTSQVNELALRVVELEMDRAGYRLWTAQAWPDRGVGGTPVAPPPWLVVVGRGAGRRRDGREVLGDGLQPDHQVLLAGRDRRPGLPADAGDAFGGKTQPGRAKELVSTPSATASCRS